jgi:hypothetical protein
MKIQYVFVCTYSRHMVGWGWGGGVQCPMLFWEYIQRARIFELLTPHIDSTESIPCWEISFVVKWFLGDIDLTWRYWRFQNSRRHMLFLVCTIIYCTEANLRFLTHRFQDPPLKQLELCLDNKTRYFSSIDTGLSVSLAPDFCKVRISNGNDIEAKRSEASIIRHFLYRSEANKLILKLWRIEAKRTKFNPFFARSKRKRNGLVQNFTETKQNQLG